MFFVNGRILFSFLSNTIDSAAVRRRSARSSGVFRVPSGAPSTIPALRDFSTAFNTLRTRSSSTSSSSLPELMACVRFMFRQRDGPGHSRSSPAAIASVVLYVPYQSETTKPFQPHSSRRMSLRRCMFSLQWVPFSLLYAVMKDPGLESRTASMKGSK